MERRIRILHTLCTVYSGGVEQRRLMLIRGLPRYRYEHLIICQEAMGLLPQLLRDEGCTIHEIGLAPHILAPSWHQEAYQIAKDYSPDVIHGAVIEGVALANGIGLRMPKVPVISEETSDPVNRSWRGNLLMRMMCIRSSTVIGVSPKVGVYLRDGARIPERKIRVINNAVLPAPKTIGGELELLRTAHGLTSTNLVIGSVGRVLDSNKRFSDLIRAMVLLRVQFPDARLLIVGEGPDLGLLRDLATELGVGGEVIFAGYQGAVRKYYPLMDVFALASEHEAFGLVLAEAMLAGVPVVATAVGGIPFVLDEGSAGRLVPPRSPEALAKSISLLLGNENYRIELGQRGKSRAEREFSSTRYCEEIEMLYKSLLP